MEKSTENKKVQLPKLQKNGRWNQSYLQDMGKWFEQNFAFRQELVSVNGRLLADVFHVSATKKITTGTDGWLYYSATLDDYKGENQLSDRGVFNIARTVALMQKKSEEKGCKFVFTVPPNKNTLYGQNMPYYEKKSGETTNLKRLGEALKAQKVHYVDLYQLFQQQKEVLYLKRDSHWNQKGAVLAYNAILDSVGWPHNQYKQVKPEVRKDNIGDLSKMLYPETATPEKNQYYPEIFSYDYLGKAKDVEDSEVSTIGYEGTGSLLMYRDSFGNTLLPLMAGEFGKSYFSKLVPYYLDEEIEKCKPDVVVVERVERHLNRLAVQPPVMEAPKAAIKGKIAEKNTDTTFQYAPMNETMYMAMGTIDRKYMNQDSLIYLKLTDEKGKSQTYEAFPITIDSKEKSTDYGYQIYLNDTSIPKGKITIEIFVKSGNFVTSVKTVKQDWRK